MPDGLRSNDPVRAGQGLLMGSLPDDGLRIFSLSETHGPSLQDTFGILSILAGLGRLSGSSVQDASPDPGTSGSRRAGCFGSVILIWSLTTPPGMGGCSTLACWRRSR
jgi:hypothetical protein